MRPPKKINSKDFHLLLSFLTESNKETLSLVKSQLKEALRRNRRYAELLNKVSDPRLRPLVESFQEELRFDEVKPAFVRLFRQGEDLDLEQGAYLLAKTEYPKLKLSEISLPLDQMAVDIDKTIAKQQPLPTRPISAVRKHLFETLKFRGNLSNFYDPENSYLNRVLKRRVGVPISLSVVYLLVSWRLRLLVHGIALPGHFLIAHRVPRGLVYVDPFNKGKIIRSKDCEVLVRRLGIPFRHAYLDPANNLQILARMIVNLINIYTDHGRPDRAKSLAGLFQLMGDG